jgi:hypothetical protein
MSGDWTLDFRHAAALGSAKTYWVVAILFGFFVTDRPWQRVTSGQPP